MTNCDEEETTLFECGSGYARRLHFAGKAADLQHFRCAANKRLFSFEDVTTLLFTLDFRLKVASAQRSTEVRWNARSFAECWLCSF